MSSQKDLERVALKEDLDQALDRMVNFEKEVNRNNEENIDDAVRQAVGIYLFGFTLGYSLTKILLYINGRSEDNQR